MTHPTHDLQLPNSEHVKLPGGHWADLKLSLTHGEAQRIEAARLEADYDTKQERGLAVAMIRSALSGAPKEWRESELGSEYCVNVAELFLERYERANETALSAPSVRANMAAAVLALNDVIAHVIVGAWSFKAPDGSPLPLVDASWETLDGRAVRIIQNRSVLLYQAWQKELGDRLKDDGSETPAENAIP